MQDRPQAGMPAASASPAPAAPLAPPPGRLARAWDSDLAYSFRRSHVAVFAGVVTLAYFLVALLAPWIAPQRAFDPAALNLMDGFLKPMGTGASGTLHVLGTDNQGRDMLSAILYGSRVSIAVGFLSVAFSLVLGVSLGLVAGFAGGRTDQIIMRVADIQLSFPAILIALLVFGIMRGLIHPSSHEQWAIGVLIVAIGLANWARYARTVRGSTMVEKNKEYVQAARVMGRSNFAIMREHVLPNVMGPVLVIATINLALAIIEEATLSLEPGEALTWPLYAPHRVENLDKFCVSLSMDFQTWPSRFRNGALYTNAVIRSRGGRPRFTETMTTPELAARWAASLALKRVGGLKSRIAHFERDFVPDAQAQDGAGALRA